jgi:hypothetical protein
MSAKRNLKMLKPLAGEVDDVPAWQAKLKSAAFDAISESDVSEIVKAMVAKAKTGDANAVKMVFELLLNPKPNTAIQNNVFVPPSPPPAAISNSRPGSSAKILELQARAERGEDLHHANDKKDHS